MSHSVASVRPLRAVLESFGEKLERYRISRNLTQAELAELAGISRSTLARMESGKGGTIDTLARLMRALEQEGRLLEIVPDARLSPLDPRAGTGQPRKRVRHRATGGEDGKPWSWSDETP